ncbi:helicase, partial [Candidatus Poribacteria bacterium]|nr:helicase [Candidatus Poribacteria bacterium]
LSHQEPKRIDFFRARIVDGLGLIAHESIFVVQIGQNGEPELCEPSILGNFSPADAPDQLPAVAATDEVTDWLQQQALAPFLEETRTEQQTEVGRISQHVELSLTELLLRTDEEVGRAAVEVEEGIQGAEGRLARAENRHAELLVRRDKRRRELEQQGALSLQAVERLTSVLVLPHPERESNEVKNLRPNRQTEERAMKAVMQHERARGCQVEDVSAKNLGYDVTSLDTQSGEMRLIEVKGLAATTGTILLTPNERRVAEDRRDCYWLYIVTNCQAKPVLQEPILDPARFSWNEVNKVQHYYLSVDAMTQPMQVREDGSNYGGKL